MSQKAVTEAILDLKAQGMQQAPLFANSIEECTDTSKLYVLSDGLIYAYMSVTETGSGYNNLADPTSSDWVAGARLNSSGTTTTDVESTHVTNFIGPIKTDDVIRIQGMDMTVKNSYPLRSNKTQTGLGIVKLTQWISNADSGSNSPVKAGGVATTTGAEFTISSFGDQQNGYWRFSGALNKTANDVIITINEEIKEETVTTQKWASTGRAFVPADYEDRIVDLEKDAADVKEDILSLQNRVEAMGSSSSAAVTIPTYWESMVAEKTETIKALQTTGGKNCVSFAWASDTHIDDNDNGKTTDIGKVMAKTMDNCEIPFAVLTGDINTRASCGTEDGLLNAQSQMPVHLAPLWGTERLLLGLGNHDGCWGDSAGYYRKQFTPERMWHTFFRWQALDFRRVFSDDGLYYYVDNAAQKMRFIMLNSHFGGEYAEDEKGWAVNNRFGTSCYGQEQLDWLADVALDMPEGYGAIITAHVPPNVTYTVDKGLLIGVVNAYNSKSSYNGSYTAGVDGWSNSTVDVDFSHAKGEIIAMFAGHVHGDSIDTETMSCPIITILSAGASPNEAYVDTAPSRTAGTDTETSFDIVTINRRTRTIYCTRVGAGQDREVDY